MLLILMTHFLTHFLYSDPLLWRIPYWWPGRLSIFQFVTLGVLKEGKVGSSTAQIHRTRKTEAIKEARVEYNGLCMTLGELNILTQCV